MPIPAVYEQPTMGKTTRMAIGKVVPLTALNATLVNRISGGIDRPQNIIDTTGLSGTRARILELQRLGTYSAGGTVEVQPTAAELDLWMELITGTTKNGSNQFPLAETLPEFHVWDKVGPEIQKTQGCKVNRAVFKAAEGGIMGMSVDIQGTSGDEDTVLANFPALEFDCTTPWVIMDASVTIDGDLHLVKNIEIDIFNDLMLDRFMNAYFRTATPPQDRIIKVRLTMPDTLDELAIRQLDPLTPIEATIEFFNDVDPPGAGYKMTFFFPKLVYNPKRPVVQGKSEVLLNAEFDAFKSCEVGAADEMLVTILSTS